MHSKKNVWVLLILSTAIISCNNKTADTKNNAADSERLTMLQFTVEKAPEWTSLFYRNKGWFGGDGIFALTKNGVEKEGSAEQDEAMIWFSDTMFGDIINDLAAQGMSILLISSDLPELLGLTDRILVMRAGKLVETVETAGLTEESLLARCYGEIELSGRNH